MDTPSSRRCDAVGASGKMVVPVQQLFVDGNSFKVVLLMVIVGSVLLALGLMTAGGTSSPAAGNGPEPVPAAVAEWFENSALPEARQLQANTVTVDGVTAGTVLPESANNVQVPRTVEGWRQAFIDGTEKDATVGIDQWVAPVFEDGNPVALIRAWIPPGKSKVEIATVEMDAPAAKAIAALPEDQILVEDGGASWLGVDAQQGVVRALTTSGQAELASTQVPLTDYRSTLAKEERRGVDAKPAASSPSDLVGGSPTPQLADGPPSWGSALAGLGVLLIAVGAIAGIRTRSARSHRTS